MRLGKLVLAASCIAAFSSSLGAQASGSLRRIDLQGTVGDMLDRMGREPRMVRTKVVGVDTTDSAFLFPSAAIVVAPGNDQGGDQGDENGQHQSDAQSGAKLLVLNSQLDKLGGTPSLPFTITNITLP